MSPAREWPSAASLEAVLSSQEVLQRWGETFLGDALFHCPLPACDHEAAAVSCLWESG